MPAHVTPSVQGIWGVSVNTLFQGFKEGFKLNKKAPIPPIIKEIYPCNGYKRISKGDKRWGRMEIVKQDRAVSLYRIILQSAENLLFSRGYKGYQRKDNKMRTAGYMRECNRVYRQQTLNQWIQQIWHRLFSAVLRNFGYATEDAIIVSSSFFPVFSFFIRGYNSLNR